MHLEKYSFGIGDRFGKQGEALLIAIQKINDLGIEVVPVWNKSHREHTTVKTSQRDVLTGAEHAIKANHWNKNYYVDADHINLENVDSFIDYSNFFTIDVAKFIGIKVTAHEIDLFIKRHSDHIGKVKVPGLSNAFFITEEYLKSIAEKYLCALNEVKKIYKYIESKKGKGNFIAEVSIDECEDSQSPIDLFFIIAELKFLKVEIHTIAPKFTGFFAKGIDYIGDLETFEKEFEEAIAIAEYATNILDLSHNLKLSVHSGSDKFSIYPAINRALKKFDAGIHVKTAGTNWLEELIGLAEAGAEGLEIAKEVYSISHARFNELTAPYSSVLLIDNSELPTPEEVNSWSSTEFSMALIHDQSCDLYNKSFRQLLHVGYKVAAEFGQNYFDALEKYKAIISKNVTNNIFERHLKLLFTNLS